MLLLLITKKKLIMKITKITTTKWSVLYGSVRLKPNNLSSVLPYTHKFCRTESASFTRCPKFKVFAQDFCIELRLHLVVIQYYIFHFIIYLICVVDVAAATGSYNFTKRVTLFVCALFNGTSALFGLFMPRMVEIKQIKY